MKKLCQMSHLGKKMMNTAHLKRKQKLRKNQVYFISLNINNAKRVLGLVLWLFNDRFVEESEEEVEVSGSSEEEEDGGYSNPYLDRNQLKEENFLLEFSESMKALSKSRDFDKENTVSYNQSPLAKVNNILYL